MIIINPSVEEIKQTDLFKHIELCGRTCYKSTDKITEDSSKTFVDKLIKANHGAMLEHGTVYLTIPCYESLYGAVSGMEYYLVEKLLNNKYAEKVIMPINAGEDYKYLVTTNFRVIVENKFESLYSKYGVEQPKSHERRRTFKIICDRSISHEFVRHRVFSFAQESQRYCNYSKDKYNNQITVIKPCYLKEDSEEYNIWKNSCENSEAAYLKLIKTCKPEEARAVLPNSTKTELIMTGLESDWYKFLELRCANSAHPQAREIAFKIKEIFDNEKNMK